MMIILSNLNPKDVPKNESERPKYFVENYCKKYPDDRGHQRIYAEDVVRPRNHKWATLDEQVQWKSSYVLGDGVNEVYHERRAPTYGTCEACWASGPSYQPCLECDEGMYMPLGLRGYIIDSQTVGEKMKKPHHTARAGLTYNRIRRDTMKFVRLAIEKQLIQDFEKKNPDWKDDEGFKFAPHQKSYAIRELLIGFFGEYEEILNQKRILQEKERVGWDIGWSMHYDPYHPEKNMTEDESNENPKKRACSRGMTEEGKNTQIR
jgi:hypothetical protein